jgi:hypothetical protein
VEAFVRFVVERTAQPHDSLPQAAYPPLQPLVLGSLIIEAAPQHLHLFPQPLDLDFQLVNSLEQRATSLTRPPHGRRTRSMSSTSTSSRRSSEGRTSRRRNVLRAPTNAATIVRQIPGARHDAKRKVWILPLSWATCVTSRGVLGSTLEVGPKLAEWMRIERAGRIERALREASDLSQTSPWYGVGG